MTFWWSFDEIPIHFWRSCWTFAKWKMLDNLGRDEKEKGESTLRFDICRSVLSLSDEYLIAKVGVDTAENEPSKISWCQHTTHPWVISFIALVTSESSRTASVRRARWRRSGSVSIMSTLPLPVPKCAWHQLARSPSNQDWTSPLKVCLQE